MTTVLRSATRCAQTMGSSFLQRQKEFRFIFKVLKTSPSFRQLSLSVSRWEDEGKRRPKKVRAASDSTGPSVSAEVQEAAKQAAKSLPGDWTKTAEELLARLQTKNSGAAQSSDEKKEVDSSMLSSMKVGRSFEATNRTDRKKNMRRGEQRQRKDDDIYSQSIVQKSAGTSSTPRERRRTPVFKDLFGQPRLGIFEAKKKSGVAPDQSAPEESTDLWAQVEKEHVRKLQGGLPRNAFEEMIRLTEQGKVWTFPVDNEADLHEERKYKFHEHIFLERHLTEFPATGPVRKFMELVALGLSQNPHITVPEKLEHIAWFAQYFREKQDVLEASLGEQGKMSELGEGGRSKEVK